MSKSYSELSKLKTYSERFQYLKLDGRVGDDTFGASRYLNQALYHSKEWAKVRRQIIIRDDGCDMGLAGYDIGDKRNLVIHHINPITIQDVVNRDYKVFDPENLVAVTKATHNAIHYGDEKLLLMETNERRANDTCPWKS